MKQDTVLNATLVLVSTSALVLTTAVLVRSLHGGSAQRQPDTREVSGWQHFASAGHRMGPAEAKVTIVEFSDFQCPYCKRSATDLRALRDKYPGQVAVIYRHYPIEQIHPQARDAALASECAAYQGRFEGFHDAVFQSQDALGKRLWTLLARDAEVPDTGAFAKCLRRKEGDANVQRDIAEGDSLGVLGTPTILINGRRIMTAPSLRLMDSLVQIVLRAK